MNRRIRLVEARVEKDVTPDVSPAIEKQLEAPLMTKIEPQIDPMHLRIVEALLFAASEPLSDAELASALPPQTDLGALIAELTKHYSERGVNLVKVANKWQFRTAKDLSFLLSKEAVKERKLSRAAIETLAIIAYHQPVTRAEIEDIRGVQVSPGTVDSLMEIGWVRIRGRRRVPGRPVTYGTTEAFLVHFGLESVGDLPGMDELRGAGFLEAVPPAGFTVPNPSDELAPDEDPYVEGEEDQPDLMQIDPLVEEDGK